MSSASYKKHIFHGVGWRPQPNFKTTEHTEYTEFFKGCCFGCSSQKIGSRCPGHLRPFGRGSTNRNRNRAGYATL